MKKYLPLTLLLAFGFVAGAQRQKMAIITPLYLDSAFNAYGELKDKSTFPRYTAAGLEFYQGAQAALDSLGRRGAPLEVVVLDSKSRGGLTQQIASPQMADVQLLIAHSSAAETKVLAEAAARKKLPFVSATLPNDAGVTNNPFLVVLNTTLRSHVEGIYRFLQKNHANDKIFVVRKPGPQEDVLKDHFQQFASNMDGKPLKLQFVEAGAGPSAALLAAQFDSTRRNVCIAGSLDEAFGQKLAQELSTLTGRYSLRLIGMPTWEKMSANRHPQLDIVYTTPFYYSRINSFEKDLADAFEKSTGSKVSDFFLRGYETTLRFALLLLDTKKDVASNLTRKGSYVFTPFDIQPIIKEGANGTLDYFENKHLYFVRLFGGVKNLIN